MAQVVAWDRPDYGLMDLVLKQAEVVYPFFLMASFGFAFAAHSVYASRHQEDIEQPTVTGPGGKPLPVTRIRTERSRRRHQPIHEFSRTAVTCFQACTVAIVLTFISHGVHIILQCVHAKWVNPERFCSDDVLVSTSTTELVFFVFFSLVNLS